MRYFLSRFPAMCLVGVAACALVPLFLKSLGEQTVREQKVDANRKVNQARLAPDLCPDYLAGTLSYLQKRDLSWCENYRSDLVAARSANHGVTKAVATDASYGEWLQQPLNKK